MGGRPPIRTGARPHYFYAPLLKTSGRSWSNLSRNSVMLSEITITIRMVVRFFQKTVVRKLM